MLMSLDVSDIATGFRADDISISHYSPSSCTCMMSLMHIPYHQTHAIITLNTNLRLKSTII